MLTFRLEIEGQFTTEQMLAFLKTTISLMALLSQFI
jgi:hypothetical protein